MNYLILIIVAGVSFAIGRKTGENVRPESGSFVQKQPEELKKLRKLSRTALTKRTEKRKEKILYLMDNEAVHDEELQACGVADIKKGITSENVKRLLDISGGTARKYLNQLEDEGKIKQIGESGPDVYYTLNT